MGATSSSSNFEEDFRLITFERLEIVILGSDVSVPCFLSPGSQSGAKDMEVRWFKDTDCLCLYKNKQLIEGMGYKNKVSMFTEGLYNNVSLKLHCFTWSDAGDYVCQVTSGDRTKEITVKVEKQNILYRYKHMVNKATVGALAVLLVMSEVIGARGVEITATAAGIAAAAAATAVANITFMKKDSTWTELERIKMEMSALLAETQSYLAERDKLKMNELLDTLKLKLKDKLRQLEEEI